MWFPQICGLCSPLPSIIGMGLQRVVMIIITSVMLSRIWKVKARFEIMKANIDAALSINQDCADPNTRLNSTYIEAGK